MQKPAPAHSKPCSVHQTIELLEIVQVPNYICSVCVLPGLHFVMLYTKQWNKLQCSDNLLNQMSMLTPFTQTIAKCKTNIMRK